MIDLHTHSTASDGTYTPSQLVEAACRRGLLALALTDHDTVGGQQEALQRGAELGLRVIPGVELAADFEGAEVHVLGYGFDPNSPAIREILHDLSAARDCRNRQMAERITQLGCPIDYDALCIRFSGSVIGRPHFAQVMAEQGFVSDVSGAFDLYLHPGGPAYISRQLYTIPKAAAAIRRAGGLTVLAHPLQYHFDNGTLHRFLQTGRQADICGLEVYYTGYTAEQRDFLRRLAHTYGFLQTGGSDFHGSGKPGIQLGDGFVPDALLEDLDRALEQCRAQEIQKGV